jgi:hypothetical protein
MPHVLSAKDHKMVNTRTSERRPIDFCRRAIDGRNSFHNRRVLWGGYPVPALVVANLHVVMNRAPCPITCARCWAHCHKGVEPFALPSAHQETGLDPPIRACARLRDNYLLHLGCLSPADRPPSFDCWIRTSSSRSSRETRSACARKSATRKDDNIFSSERSCRE